MMSLPASPGALLLLLVVAASSSCCGGNAGEAFVVPGTGNAVRPGPASSASGLRRCVEKSGAGL